MKISTLVRLPLYALLGPGGYSEAARARAAGTPREGSPQPRRGHNAGAGGAAGAGPGQLALRVSLPGAAGADTAPAARTVTPLPILPWGDESTGVWEMLKHLDDEKPVASSQPATPPRTPPAEQTPWPSPSGTPPWASGSASGPATAVLCADAQALIGEVQQLRSLLRPGSWSAGGPGMGEIRSEWDGLAERLAEAETRLADNCRALMIRALPSLASAAQWPSAEAVLAQITMRLQSLNHLVTKIHLNAASEGTDKVSQEDVETADDSVANALVDARKDPEGTRSPQLRRVEASEASLHLKRWRLEKGRAELPTMQQELSDLRQCLPLIRQCTEELATRDRPAVHGSQESVSPRVTEPSTPRASPDVAMQDHGVPDETIDRIEAALPRGGAALRRLEERAARRHPATFRQLLRAVKKPRPLQSRREHAFEALVRQDVQALAAAGRTTGWNAAQAMRTVVEEGLVGPGILQQDRQVLLRLLEKIQLDDPHAGLRVPAGPVPAEAPYRLTVALLEQYAGDEAGGTRGGAVTYLDPEQRQAHEIHVRDGLLFDAQGQPFDTRGSGSAFSAPDRAIFVMDPMGRLYATNPSRDDEPGRHHVPGRFNHASFLAGGPVAAAGEIKVHHGVVLAVTNRCDVYQPPRALLQQVRHRLEAQGVRPAEKPQTLADLLNHTLKIPLSGIARAAGPDGFEPPGPADLQALRRDYTAQEIDDIRTALALAMDHPHLDYAALLPPGEQGQYSSAQVFQYLAQVAEALKGLQPTA
jgi:hypothetical protein